MRRICFCEEKKLKKEWFLLLFFAVVGVFMIALNNLIGINSIFASSAAMIVVATEMLWGLSWGLVWGPMYEFLVGARTLRIRRN